MVNNLIKLYPSGKRGKLIWQGRFYRAALGRGGVSPEKKEGDGKTPAGCFPLRQVFYRPDRLSPPRTSLPIQPLKPDYGWDDNPASPSYNRLVRISETASFQGEQLWRQDNLYDLVVIVGYNDDPPIPGRGSAIFIHIARPNYSPTAGCVALSQKDLQEILEGVSTKTQICIYQEPLPSSKPNKKKVFPGKKENY
jgi:L,D-peptidoglycan transpeptidase YkuD (ErfK/YbiS/YcfS/YnhG family)